MIPNFIKTSKYNLGSSLSLPAYGRVGQGQRFSAAHFAKRNTKNCGGEKRSGESEGGQKFLPPNPLPFCPPERKSFNQNSHSGFSSKKVRPSSRNFVSLRGKDFVQKAPPIFRIRILGDCCLAPPEAGLGFGKDFEGIFEIQKQFLPAQTEVRRAKRG